jgi:hypothetical protein
MSGCKVTSDNYMGLQSSTWHFLLTIFVAGFILFLLANRVNNPIDVLKTTILHCVEIFAIVLFGRFFGHIPGLYQSAFYYLAVSFIYYKLSRRLDEYQQECATNISLELTNQTAKNVFYVHSFLVVAGIIMGFYEKYHRSFFPNCLVIDLLITCWSVSIKPWAVEQINTYGELELLTNYEERMGTALKWIEDGVTLFFSARNIGMMVYCSGLIARPCKSLKMTM